MKVGTDRIALLFWMMGFVVTAVAGEGHGSPARKPDAPLSVPSPLTVSLAQENMKVKITPDNAIDFLKIYPANKIQPGLTNVLHRNLSEIPLEKWLVSIMGDAPLEWSSGECIATDSDIEESAVEDADTNDSDNNKCTLLSVNVSTPKTHCPSVELMFGIDQDAAVHLMYEGSEVNDFGARGHLEQLADLERALMEVKSKAATNRPSSAQIDKLRARKVTDFTQYAAGLDVSRFDPSLPSERFDKWLERISGWSFHWTTLGREGSGYFHQCKFTPIEIYVLPVSDTERRSPPISITMTLGSWEEEIRGEPKLSLYVIDKHSELENARFDRVKNLSEFKNEIEAWKATPKPQAKVISKPVLPKYKPTLPIVQDLISLGGFSRMRTTPNWHCYGHILNLWKYGERVFGIHHDFGGQCADSREPTYIIRDVKYDPKTGALEFWSYGTPGNKFVGKIDGDMVTGKFLEGFDEEEVKLKGGKNDDEPLLDSDKNLEAWCKGYAPTVQNIVKEELENLCVSLGIK